MLSICEHYRRVNSILRTGGGLWHKGGMNHVAAYKKATGLSLAELAAKLGVKSRGHLSNVVMGKRPVTVSMAKKLAAICDKPWHELIDG